MSTSSLKYITAIILVFVFFQVQGQIDLKLRSSVDTVRIGGEISLDMDIGPGENNIKSVRLNIFDSLGLAMYLFPGDSALQDMNQIPVDFEIVIPGNWSIKNAYELIPQDGRFFEADEKGLVSNRIQLKIWDPGYFVILPEWIEWEGEDGSSNQYFPETKHAVLIYVESPEEQKEGDIEMRPIKDIIREGWHWSDFKWLYIAVGAIVLFVILINRPVKQKRRKAKTEVIVIRPAHEIALEKLSILEKSQLWQKGEYKAFLSELSYVLREYLENRYDIKALESTTSEIVREISKVDFSNDDISELRNLLEISDLVKFAKAKPDDKMHERFINQTIDFVNRTKKVKQAEDE